VVLIGLGSCRYSVILTAGYRVRRDRVFVQIRLDGRGEAIRIIWIEPIGIVVAYAANLGVNDEFKPPWLVDFLG